MRTSPPPPPPPHTQKLPPPQSLSGGGCWLAWCSLLVSDISWSRVTSCWEKTLLWKGHHSPVEEVKYKNVPRFRFLEDNAVLTIFSSGIIIMCFILIHALCCRPPNGQLRTHTGTRRARPRSIFHVRLFNGNLESYIKVPACEAVPLLFWAPVWVQSIASIDHQLAKERPAWSQSSRQGVVLWGGSWDAPNTGLAFLSPFLSFSCDL